MARAGVARWSRAWHIEPPGWDMLERELASCAGRVQFWWRDDDATTPTPALHRLLALREALGLPLALAVIPAMADAALAATVPARDVAVLAHGWDHADHSAPAAAPAELAAGRAPAEVADQLRRGRLRLAALFGDRVLPVLVPPFNALDPSLSRSVRQAGYSHVSVDRDFPGLGLRSVNVHADIMDWQAGTAADPARVVRGLVAALRLRRLGLVARATPVGVMTHHLVQDEPAWALTEATLARLAAHPAVVFPPIAAMLAA